MWITQFDTPKETQELRAISQDSIEKYKLSSEHFGVLHAALAQVGDLKAITSLNLR